MSAADAVRAIEQLVEGGGDADDVLRGVVATLHDEAGYAWVGIFFVEQGELVLGPSAGTEEQARRTQVPVVYDGARIAELAADGTADRPQLEHVADVIAAHCLVGWDTGGEQWTP